MIQSKHPSAYFKKMTDHILHNWAQKRAINYIDPFFTLLLNFHSVFNERLSIIRISRTDAMNG